MDVHVGISIFSKFNFILWPISRTLSFYPPNSLTLFCCKDSKYSMDAFMIVVNRIGNCGLITISYIKLRSATTYNNISRNLTIQTQYGYIFLYRVLESSCHLLEPTTYKRHNTITETKIRCILGFMCKTLRDLRIQADGIRTAWDACYSHLVSPIDRGSFSIVEHPSIDAVLLDLWVPWVVNGIRQRASHRSSETLQRQAAANIT